MASTSSILVQHLGEKSFTGRMENDETIALSSGEFPGFSPMDHLLIGLAGCTGTGIRDILRKMRQDVTDYQIRVRDVLSEEAPRIWTTIDVEHIFTGKNLNADRIQHAIDLDIATRCDTMPRVVYRQSFLKRGILGDITGIECICYILLLLTFRLPKFRPNE